MIYGTLASLLGFLRKRAVCMSSTELVLFSAAYLAGFAAIHSLLITHAAKDWARRKWGRFAPFYRLAYNISQIGLLLLFGYLFMPWDPVLGRWPFPLSWLARAVQACGLMVILWVLLFSFDFGEFLGLKQVREVFSPSPSKAQPPPLHRAGPYQWCRHPLYLATTAVFLFEPNVTALTLVMAVFVALYGYFGSIPEERKLITIYGEDYLRYQAETKRLIPFLL